VSKGQYSGTAGKIENCQLAVHLVYATETVHAMLDAALYLPKSWCDDPERRAEAGVPEQVRFATKPQLASRMIETAVTAGLPCRWVAGDEAYGGDPRLAAPHAATGLPPGGGLLASGCHRPRCLPR
jgi:SRSO17 transposase